MKTLRSADIVGGCFLAVLGVLTIWASSNIVTTMEHRLSPRALPYAVGILIFGCGVGMAIKAWRSQSPGAPISWPDAWGVRIIAVTLLSIAFYNGTLEFLGLPVATFIYVAFSIWYLNRARWGIALATGIACGVISHFVFIQMLGLSFPEGTLFHG